MPHQHGFKRLHGHMSLHLDDVKARNALPEPAPQPDPKHEDVRTIVSSVFQTLSKTFDGPAVYYTVAGDPIVRTRTSNRDPTTTTAAEPTTRTPDPDAESTQAAAAAAAATTEATSEASSAAVHTQAISSETLQSTSIAAITSAAVTSITTTTSAVITPLPTVQSSASTSSASAAVAAASSTASPDVSSSKGGMSGGAKAGLAFGLLFAVAAVLGLVLCFYRRKKKQTAQLQRLDDEKVNVPDAIPPPVQAVEAPPSIRTARTASSAPRLSLRPLTEFQPNLGGDRRSTGNQLAAAAGGISDSNGYLSATSKPNGSAWERRAPQNSANDPSNPFGNHAETLEPPTPQNVPLPASPAPSTPTKPDAIVPPSMVGAVEPPSPIDVVPKPLSIRSEAGSQTSLPAATPVRDAAAAGATTAMATPGAPSNVHRVQLDFKPTMDDELELRAGQLVRMLHEYDDGWALCIRLDRSQQGVIPRTCLSKHPVKPRPANPPPQDQPSGSLPRARGPPMALQPGQPRPVSPPSGSGSPALQVTPPPSLTPATPPRPLSPAAGQGLPESKAASFAAQPGSMSPVPGAGAGVGVDARSSPPTAVPSRKPVPGRGRDC